MVIMVTTLNMKDMVNMVTTVNMMNMKDVEITVDTSIMVNKVISKIDCSSDTSSVFLSAATTLLRLDQDVPAALVV